MSKTKNTQMSKCLKNKKNFLTNFKIDKKAVVEVQFHWIFVLIVGGIILLFFISKQ